MEDCIVKDWHVPSEKELKLLCVEHAYDVETATVFGRMEGGKFKRRVFVFRNKKYLPELWHFVVVGECSGEAENKEDAKREVVRLAY